jgi:hypothetical protein
VKSPKLLLKLESPVTWLTDLRNKSQPILSKNIKLDETRVIFNRLFHSNTDKGLIESFTKERDLTHLGKLRPVIVPFFFSTLFRIRNN